MKKKLMPWSSKWGAILISIMMSACASSNLASQTKSYHSIDANNNEGTSEVIAITEELVISQKKQRDQLIGEDLERLKVNPEPYEIGPGDVLSVVVWGHPELVASAMMAQLPALSSASPGSGAEQPPSGFVVDQKGLMQYPYIGALKVSGLTEMQARELIANKIAHYINNPNVTLRVQAYRSKRIYVDGEVRVPGVESINDIPMSLMEALNRAGGMLSTADQSQINIIRGSAIYHINIPKLVQKGVDPSSLILVTGDIVRVLSREESKIFVSGEVTTPKSLTMHDGKLTLNEALGESGGVNPLSGDAGQVFVIRNSQNKAEVYKLNGSTPEAMAIAENFELFPKDQIYVAPTNLTNWHRTISLIFPSALSSAVGAGK